MTNKALGWCGMAAVALAAVTPGTAFAKSKEEGWHAWADRAAMIDAALKAEDPKAALNPACSGVTGTVIGQGFMFPDWGRALIRVCQATKGNWIYMGTRRGAKLQCRDLKRVIHELNEATSVAEEPRAEGLARSIAATLQGGVTEFC